jgi:hemerythrin superfamily protein
MDNFDLKQYLTENKLTESTVNDPSNVIQRKLKQLAGYHPADIKNALDDLGAEEFKKQLEDLKSYVDQYFNEKPINSLSEMEETPTFKDEVISHLKSLSDKNNMNLNDSYWEWFRNTGNFNDMIETELMNRKNPKQAAISIFSIWR